MGRHTSELENWAIDRSVSIPLQNHKIGVVSCLYSSGSKCGESDAINSLLGNSRKFHQILDNNMIDFM